MNIYSLIGLVSAAVVLVTGLFLATDDIKMFWDFPSLFIVVGGSIAAISISFQMNKVFSLLKVFLHKVLKGKSEVDFPAVIQEILLVAQAYQGPGGVKAAIETAQDPFLKEGLELVQEGVMDTDTILEVMESRKETLYSSYLGDAEKFKTMGKYPPAFGMMGTTIGMVVLLANLGGEDAMQKIGPAMGVCLITTLYGVIIANMAIVPIGENLEHGAKQLKLKNNINLAGIVLIMEGTNLIVLAEKLNSFLLPSQRLDWKEVISA